VLFSYYCIRGKRNVITFFICCRSEENLSCFPRKKGKVIIAENKFSFQFNCVCIFIWIHGYAVFGFFSNRKTVTGNKGECTVFIKWAVMSVFIICITYNNGIFGNYLKGKRENLLWFLPLWNYIEFSYICKLFSFKIWYLKGDFFIFKRIVADIYIISVFFINGGNNVTCTAFETVKRSLR